MNAVRIRLHSFFTIPSALSKCPTSNCCTASRHPRNAWCKFTWQISHVPMHGTANWMGNKPRFLQVRFRAPPRNCIRSCNLGSVSIASQLPRTNSCALSKFKATANSRTYASANVSVLSKTSMLCTGKRLTTKAEMKNTIHALMTYCRLVRNSVHFQNARHNKIKGNNSVMQTLKSTRNAPRRTSPRIPANKYKAFSFVYTTKLGFGGFPCTQAS
mmetsp:Transcript_111566/g.322464  ORF Transcript_111566/g.322464 Transcript_111566/m.322464 type:complete len:215 (-) Transcript_111566:554-1198(-)